MYVSHIRIVGMLQHENKLPYLPTPPLGQDMTPGHFKAKFNRFEFRVFLLLD